MIVSLSIENFALIEKLSVRFSDGFSVITGETGAGKSILLGALGLVLGKRADFNLNELQELSNFLIDIHSQHQTQELSEDGVQFQIIDSVASNEVILNEFCIQLKEYKKIKSEIKLKRELLLSFSKEQDYNSFLLEELLAAKLKSGEQELLESQFEKLNNVELINENLSRILSLSNQDQFGVIQGLKEIKVSIQKIASYSQDFSDLSERISSLLIEFDDIANEISDLAESIHSDPVELQLLNEKLQLIYSLQKKHQVNSVDELLVIQNELDSKVVSSVTLESEISSLEKQLQNTESTLDDLAATLHNNRIKSIPVLTKKMEDILSNLGMVNARFDIQLIQKEVYLNNGKDEIQFLFSANKGSEFGLLKKVASGGEMSRIMLAVKSILSQYSKLPTIIFDEIDTGVSGEIAHKMGEILKGMSSNMQVFAITHLPQIAGKGKEHIKVYKVIKENQTLSELKLLKQEERVLEIAQMLSGSNVTETALNHAKELLN